MATAVFHEGERAVQELAGETFMADRNSAIITDRISGSALPFIRQQSMAILGTIGGTIDPHADIWCSILFGSPGFMRSGAGDSVEFDLRKMFVQPLDPFWDNIQNNPRAGMLVIELESRRRIRVNGTIARLSGDLLSLQVSEAYVNCAKYITRRQVTVRALDSAYAGDYRQGTALQGEQVLSVTKADALFVASAHPTRGVDASHRGGAPGFVELLDPTRIRIPDYPGNSMFNTLGNLAVNAHAGVAIPDFERGRVLQLTGQTEILWNLPDPHNLTGGTQRFWTLHIEQWRELPLPSGVQTQFGDLSRFNPPVK